MGFQFVQIAYWLALATWFGAVLFVALAPPIIQRTVRSSNPILPGVLSVNLEGQHGTLLAGSIVADLLAPLVKIELACACVLLLAIVAQWFLVDLHGANVAAQIGRTAMYVAAVRSEERRVGKGGRPRGGRGAGRNNGRE